MALYDDKYWLLSHIRHSFITTDDTGMCELVMTGENTKHLKEQLNIYPDPDESEDSEDDMPHESCEIGYGSDFGMRARTNTAARIEKIEQAKKRAAKMKIVKWETNKQESEDLFVRKDPKQNKTVLRKSLLSERLEKCTNLPHNPYISYSKFDGNGQVNVPTRQYKIFLTMLNEEHKNYPIDISCMAIAKIQDLIGLILLKVSTLHGDVTLHPVNHYGLYITEEDGEVYRDLPNLDSKECIAKFGFTCLGLVEHKDPSKIVTFDQSVNKDQDLNCTGNGLDSVVLRKSTRDTLDETRQITSDLEVMAVHKKAMEAPLYQSYKVSIVNKMRTRIDIHLGVSGDKIEIDPIQQQTSKFALAKQKPVSHHMDSIAWCEITDSRSSKSTFRVVYSLSFGSPPVGVSTEPNFTGISSFSPLQTSASFKHYDFEADHCTAEEIVEKINLILELRASFSRKEYLAARERKQYKRKSFKLTK